MSFTTLITVCMTFMQVSNLVSTVVSNVGGNSASDPCGFQFPSGFGMQPGPGLMGASAGPRQANRRTTGGTTTGPGGKPTGGGPGPGGVCGVAFRSTTSVAGGTMAGTGPRHGVVLFTPGVFTTLPLLIIVKYFWVISSCGCSAANFFTEKLWGPL